MEVESEPKESVLVAALLKDEAEDEGRYKEEDDDTAPTPPGYARIPLPAEGTGR